MLRSNKTPPGNRFCKQLFFIILFLSILACGCNGFSRSTPVMNDTTGIAPGTPAQDILTVHFIDVGQGDSMLIQIDDRSMLIDGGPRKAGPGLAAYLKSQGVSSLDVVVSTHPHADHIGGLISILKEFPVKQIVDSGQVHTTQTYEQYLTLIDQKNIPYTVGEMGQSINLSPKVRVDILGPSGTEKGLGLNENSIVIKLTYHNVSFLFMGDAGFPEERTLMSSGADLKSDVLKVPHHGSKYSSSAAFLSKVHPEVSVIEVGKNNDYGHPAPRTLKRLEKTGTVIYRTDIDGNIVVRSDGTDFTVITQCPKTERTFIGMTPVMASALLYPIMLSCMGCVT